MKPELKRKLEIALCSYLPYGLKCRTVNGNCEYTIDLDGSYLHSSRMINLRPILHSLSDLTKEIEHDGEKFKATYILSKDFKDADDYIVQLAMLCESNDKFINEFILWCPNNVMQKLFKYHFDVFGLIDEGLAVDINKI